MILNLLSTEDILGNMIQYRELKSMCIDYHPPVVKRIWFQSGGYRVYLHKIMPCKTSAEALYHPHPWQSAIRILKGKYEMGVGHSATNRTPLITDCKLILPKDTIYEMTDQDSWHYVNPIDEPVYSLMVTAYPNKRQMPVEPQKQFEKLTFTECQDILSVFHAYYKWEFDLEKMAEISNKLSE